MSLKSKPKFMKNVKSEESQYQRILYLPTFIETSITLLLSPETDIVLRSLQVITKHCGEDPANALDIFRKGIFPKLTTLLYHEDLNVLKYTLDLLSQFVAFAEVLQEFELESNRPYIKKIQDFYLKHENTQIMEFTSRILSKLVTRPPIEYVVADETIFKKIFDNLETTEDPDIQRNNLEFLHNIVCNQKRVKNVAKTDKFSFSFIVCYTKSDIDTISSLAIDTLKKFVVSSSKLFWEKIHHEKIVETILGMIFDVNKTHLYTPILEIVDILMSDKTIVDGLIRSEVFVGWLRWILTCPEQYFLLSATILAKVTGYVEYRIYLYSVQIVDTILSLFRSNHPLVLQKVCICVSNMSTSGISCESMITTVIIKCLIDLLRHNETQNVVLSLDVLHNFLKRSEKTKHMLVTFNGVESIVNLYRTIKDHVNPETYLKIMDMIHIYATVPQYRELVMDEDTFRLLFEQFLKDPSSVMALKSINILACYVHEKNLRNYFITIEGPQKIVSKMALIKNEVLLKNTLLFIHNICCYKEMTPFFLSGGLIKQLDVIADDIKDTLPFIKLIKSMMYDIYLPLKFHLKNRLEINDRITSRFFMFPGKCTKFMFLEILQALNCCPIDLIYSVDFTGNSDLLYEVIYEESFHSLNSLKQKSSKSLNQKRRSSQSITSKKSLETIPEEDDVEGIPLRKVLKKRVPASVDGGESTFIAEDPYLSEYTEQIYTKIYLPDRSLCFEHKIRTLSLFVVNRLSGLDDYYHGDNVSPVWQQRFKLHLQALKEKLNNNIIPVGFLRIGGPCERGLLFKALADRLTIPSAFVRGPNGVYWNEVVLIPAEHGQSIQYGVVDLMKDIGSIYVLGTKQANVYCGVQ